MDLEARAERDDGDHSAGVGRPAMDEVAARYAVVIACGMVGMDGTNADLIRLGSNGVFRLPSGKVVARVGRSAERLAGARREVAVARGLADEHVPAIRALDVEQPVVAATRCRAWGRQCGQRDQRS